MTTWQTDPTTGLVTVDFGSGPQVPVFTGSTAQKVKTNVADKWRDLLTKYSAQTGVPFAHLAGIIYRESGGNANAINLGDNPHGVGLFQITSKVLRAGHTDDELKDPELNFSIGAPYFSDNWHKYSGDLPKTAAAHNVGSFKLCSAAQIACCNDKSQCPAGKTQCWCNTDWGVMAFPGHITDVVKASNTIIQNGWDGGQIVVPPPPGPGPDPNPNPTPNDGPPLLSANISGQNPGPLSFVLGLVGGYVLLRWAVPTIKKRWG